jgi:hypothetical protein
VSDLLDRIAEPGLDLLRRVDTALATAGAPADDPVWPLLRRAGALPGEVVAHLLAADPQPLVAAGDGLRAESTDLSRAADAIPGLGGWRGHAADEFAAQWSAGIGQVDRITQRLSATADYSVAVTAWLTATRRQVAVAVAECLASTEAATVRLGAVGADAGAGAATGVAAAAIAGHVLGAVLDAVETAHALAEQWAGRLDEVPYRAATPIANTATPRTIEF